MSITALAAALATFQQAPCAIEDAPASFEKDNGVECGWVAIPRDASSGKVIRLWTARVHATGSHKDADPLLYINGGPGIATVDSVVPALPVSANLKALREGRDIVIFDQRGSGRSEEALCPDLAKTLNDISALGLAPPAEEERNRAAFKQCREQLGTAGIDLNSYSTATTVRDIEALRQAFNVERWNLLSVSYGTLVALHAMRTNPQTVRSAILNSPYPPNSVTWAEQASTAAAAYQAIDRACAVEPACRKRFGNLVPKLEATIARLERTPLKDGDKTITGRRFAEALWPLAVQSKTVRFVPLAISRAYSGDDALIRKLVATFAGGEAFGGFSPAQAYAISCHEGGRTRESYARAQALYPGLVSPAPADSWDRMCATLRPGYADPSFFAPVASSIPTLIYAGTLDPSVPVVDAYQSMRFLTNATLVEVKGASHAPIGADDCTRSIAIAFLAQPETAPSTACMEKRVAEPFASEGLDALVGSGS
jgi:pimeloyl-ACP methyl ester carboxylesterase